MSQHNLNDVVNNGMQSCGSLPPQQQQQQPQALTYPNATFPSVANNVNTPQQRLLQLQIHQQQLLRLQTQQQQQQQLLRQQQEHQQPYQQQLPQQQQNSQQQQQGHKQFLQQRELQRQSSASSLTSIPSLPSISGHNPSSPQTQNFLMNPPELPDASKLIPPPLTPGTPAKGSALNDSLHPQPQHISQEEAHRLLSQCNTADRTIWVAHQLLGGPQANGFLRSTSTAQRIKKQRARQVQWVKKEGHDELQQEEDMKQVTMNPRTAKKIKMELTSGLSFCRQLHHVVRGLLAEMDPTYVVAPLEGQKADIPINSTTIPPPISASVAKLPILPPPRPPLVTNPSKRLSTKTAITAPSKAQQQPSNSNPGDPTGSTLRKLRKFKLSVDSTIKLPVQFSKLPKKEQSWRLFSILRFRALQPGDYVAARVTSRDLWILARTVKPYGGVDIKSFLSLTDAKRDALFHQKVVIKDVEEKEGGANALVSRNLVLPLPRTYGEAAEWNTRIKKGSRVYAMYPNTTSLYSATAIDSTTYCRGDDDVVVVEFDGDDQDESGNLPKYHIPARFVTLIPRDFPAANITSKKKRTIEPIVRNSMKHKRVASSDSALNEMISEMAYGDLPNQELNLDQFDMDL